MAIILNIETATSVCSAALAENGKILAVRESAEPNVHAEKLAVFIYELLEELALPFPALDAIAIGTGPGSYTGLRIGTSTAKGLCYALDKPLIAIPTLKAMALASAVALKRKDIYYCSLIDARRLEVYTAIYDFEGREVLQAEAKILNETSFLDILNEKGIAFAGDGMLKMKKLSPQDDMQRIWMDDVYASAKNMVHLSDEVFLSNQFADVAYYEPYYLKDFVAGKKII
jgi:tRNA threonylcarbamoyladenosine biosynthesis protein TsaB